MAAPSGLQKGRARSRAKLIIVLFTVFLGVLVAETVSSPYVVTVYSQGCWSVHTDGFFHSFDTSGCGVKSWTLVDLYAHVRADPIVGGSSGVGLVLTMGVGPGGGCVGTGERCPNDLFTYQPPSPVSCEGCVVASAGLPNPVRDFFEGGLSSYPFVEWIFIAYLAFKIRDASRIYSSLLRGERDEIQWTAISGQRKVLTAFSIVFVAYLTYQYVATWWYVLVNPVPTLGFPFQGLVAIPVAVWLARFRSWSLPIKGLATSGLALDARRSDPP